MISKHPQTPQIPYFLISFISLMMTEELKILLPNSVANYLLPSSSTGPSHEYSSSGQNRNPLLHTWCVNYLKLLSTKENFFNYLGKMPSFFPPQARISCPLQGLILSNATAHFLCSITVQFTAYPSSLWSFQRSHVIPSH